MPLSSAPQYDFFVSFANADRAWVEGFLLDALRGAGIQCIDEEMFRLGVPRLTEFERAVEQSRHTILVLTPAYLSDNYTQFVDLLANTFGLETSSWPVIPLLLQPTLLPTRLAMLTRLDAINPATWPNVIAQLCREVGSAVPQITKLPACPYPGMRPFVEADSEQFYGRDAEIDDMVQRLRQHHFLAVIGPSGSGKSSLVFAGLPSALRKSTLFGSNQWRVYTMRPGDQPLATLAQVLGVTNAEQFNAPANEQVLLVIDQFEELFTLHSTEARLFAETLNLISKRNRCLVVLTVRADFYAEVMVSPLWPEIQRHRLEILPLDENGLRAAIIKPAERLGVYIESALVERVVINAAGQPGVLPFVQELLVLLWEHIERRFLPLRAYEALVLPYKSITGEQRSGLQVAMARKADQIFAELSDEQQHIARRIFLRLVQFGEGRSHTRRQQTVAALRSADEDSALFDKTLHYLGDNRLLTLSGYEQMDRKADLSHEAIITGWPLLSQWVAERRTAEETRRWLEEKAAEWVRLSKVGGGLLDAAELREAEQWLASPFSKELGTSYSLQKLLTESRSAIQETQFQQQSTKKFRRIVYSVVGVLLGLISLALIGVGINLGHTWWLNRTWVGVNNPPGALLSVIGANQQIAIGSYHHGVAWLGTDGRWTEWQNLQLPRGTQAVNSNDPTANVREVDAIALDSLHPDERYILVRNGGLYRYEQTTQNWHSINAGTPLNTEATTPLAVYDGKLLFIGDTNGVYASPDQGQQWQELSKTIPILGQQWDTVAFDADGTPYLGGNAGLYRGQGNFPWTWEPLLISQPVRFLAIGPKKTLFVVARDKADATQFFLGCYSAQGAPIGWQIPLPITNRILHLVQIAKVSDIVAHGQRADIFYMADNYAAVYEINCAGHWRQIGQDTLESVPSRLAFWQKDKDAAYLLWANQNGLRVHKLNE